jgi:2-methylcitrate dehydratase PrpD
MDGVWDKAMTFKLVMALAARNGIFSAELAAQGFTGTKDAFLGKHGFFSLYSRDPDTSGLTKDLGKKFYADRVIKPYSACRATHSSIDCAMSISSANDIQVEDVESITVKAHPGIIGGFTGGPFGFGETSQIDGAFSIRYTVATALLRKGVKPAYFSDECTRDPKILKLIEKTQLVGTAPSDATTTVEVKMTNGKVLSGSTNAASGDIFNTPLSDDRIRAKFRDNVAFSRTVPTEKAEKALSLLEDLENVADIRDIIALVA